LYRIPRLAKCFEGPQPRPWRRGSTGSAKTVRGARLGPHPDVVIVQLNEEFDQLELVAEDRLKFVPRQGAASRGVHPERVLECPTRDHPDDGHRVAPHAFLDVLDVARPVPKA
jgi:hypothetical protein